MPGLSKTPASARTAVAYVTVGALVDVWTVIYWTYLRRHPEGHEDATYYWVYGFFFTGLVLFAIGLTLGRIARAARHAELPPEPVRTLTIDSPVVATLASTVPAAPPNATPVPTTVPVKPVAVAMPVTSQQGGFPVR
jgi:hypothetical protein